MADIVGLLGQYAAFIISAIFTALAFWWKKQTDFKPIKFIETVITAFILATVAFVLVATGLIPTADVMTVETYLYTFGLAGPFTLLVQALAQGIYRRIMG